MPRKCIMILLDGLGDRSYPELGHRTPLQAAATPALDRIARDGANGLYHAAHLGQALPSENAHFAMFGYDMDGFPGRGALEALGADISLDAGQVALLPAYDFIHVHTKAPDETAHTKNPMAKCRAKLQGIMDTPTDQPYWSGRYAPLRVGDPE